MRHRKAGIQLGRNSSHRRAMLRNMVTSVIKHEQIVTTDAKAKTVRPIVEKMITLAKRGDLHARRQALSYMQDKAVTHQLFGDLKDRFMDRQGGYVRIIKKGNRKGDGAPRIDPSAAARGRREKSKEKEDEKGECRSHARRPSGGGDSFRGSDRVRPWSRGAGNPYRCDRGEPCRVMWNNSARHTEPRVTGEPLRNGDLFGPRRHVETDESPLAPRSGKGALLRRSAGADGGADLPGGIPAV